MKTVSKKKRPSAVKAKVIDLSQSTETDPKKVAELLRDALEKAFPTAR
jgi:hypothetical protein